MSQPQRRLFLISDKALPGCRTVSMVHRITQPKMAGPSSSVNRIQVYAADYQLITTSKKRSTPREDWLLPPTKRIKIGEGEDSKQEHLYQELPRDLSEAHFQDLQKQPCTECHDFQRALEGCKVMCQDVQSRLDEANTTHGTQQQQLEQQESEREQAETQHQQALRLAKERYNKTSCEAEQKISKLEAELKARDERISSIEMKGNAEHETRMMKKNEEFETHIKEIREKWKKEANDQHEKLMEERNTQFEQQIKKLEDELKEKADFEHQKRMTEKENEIKVLKEELENAAQAAQQDKTQIARLQTDLQLERERTDFIEDRETKSTTYFLGKIKELNEKRNNSEARHIRRSVKLAKTNKRLETEVETLEKWQDENNREHLEELCGVKDKMNEATARLAAVEEAIRKRKDQKANSGRGGFGEPKKVPRSVKKIGVVGQSRSGIGKVQKKAAKKSAKKTATGSLRCPTVTQDLYKLRKKGDLYEKKDIGLEAIINQSTDVETLIQSTESLDFKRCDHDVHAVDNEDENGEDVGQGSEDEAPENGAVEDEFDDLEEALYGPIALPHQYSTHVHDTGDDVPMDKGDENADEDCNGVDSNMKAEEAARSDDELEELDDADFSLEDVANATADSFY